MRWLYIRIIGGLLLLLALSGCVPFSANSSELSPLQMPMRELLLGVAVYPSGWAEDGMTRNEEYPGGDSENIGIVFRYRSEEANVSTHTILRYKTRDDAQNGFDALLAQNNVLYQDLAQFKELTYTSQTAQRISILCSHRPYSVALLPPLCIAVAQYGPYVSVFSAPIDSRSMRNVDFLHILQEIDKKMAVVADK